MIAHNVLCDHYKKKTAPADGEEIEATVAPSFASPQPDVLLMQKELGEWIAQAESNLSPKLATCFRMRMRDQMSFKEMAERLGEPADRLMGRTYLALKEMRQAYHRRFSRDD